jgi:hypothetical protein
MAEVGGICYTLTAYPHHLRAKFNTTVFSVLWPPSIALWGSLVSRIAWWCD